MRRDALDLGTVSRQLENGGVSKPSVATYDKGDPTCTKLLRTWLAICSGGKLEAQGGEKNAPLRSGISFMVQEGLDLKNETKVEMKR
jgi:hypothetical protein